MPGGGGAPGSARPSGSCPSRSSGAPAAASRARGSRGSRRGRAASDSDDNNNNKKKKNSGRSPRGPRAADSRNPTARPPVRAEVCGPCGLGSPDGIREGGASRSRAVPVPGRLRADHATRHVGASSREGSPRDPAVFGPQKRDVSQAPHSPGGLRAVDQRLRQQGRPQLVPQEGAQPREAHARPGAEHQGHLRGGAHVGLS